MANLKTPNTLQRRSLTSVEHNGVTLLEAVAVIQDAKRTIFLFFQHDTELTSVAPGNGLCIIDQRSVGNAPILICEADSLDGPVQVMFGDLSVQVTPTFAETNLYAGKNVFVSVRNGESADVILDWLKFHCVHHGLEGAVILNRAKPGTDKKFERKLEKGLKKLSHACVVTLLDANIALGRADLPPESHPFCVPEAPGKDRMKVADPEPWASPLAEVVIYEVFRRLFLDKARAVANIDVFDLLEIGDRQSVFDAVVASSFGVIPLVGRHCYPWRVRKGNAATFGDHICVQFDVKKLRKRWCIAPQKAGESAVWRLVRIGKVESDPDNGRTFFRFMALRHPTHSVSKIVPKSSLIENEKLLYLAQNTLGHTPVRMPEISSGSSIGEKTRSVIITTMKNEGPFILEWIAYHRAIGFDDFLIYTNDCTDGTDTLLDMLQSKGVVQHRDNPFRNTGLKPQHAALQAAESEPIVSEAKWLVCMDVDEYINIKVGEGTLSDLFAAVPDANMIAMTWRLFGNADIHKYEDEFITEKFTRCAHELTRKPHQAWGFKTIFQNIGLFKKLGVHRPKGLNPQLLEKISWVNGSGVPLPKEMFRNSWRSTVQTFGYDLVSLNHYAVRSAESFLVKRDRGRVNHVNRDQGLAYWFRMNNNVAEDRSIQAMAPKLKAEYERLLSDPEIAALHKSSVKSHRDKIFELLGTKKYSSFYSELTSPRMQLLSRMHAHFGANVFLAGPDCIPQNVLEQDPDSNFFFTVERQKTNH